jgi:uncharacterized protein (DUF342 family)
MKRTRNKLVIFTEEEWEHITKSADECGMKVGTYIQTMAVRGQVIKCDLNETGVLKELFEIKTELKRIGNNINQIAYKVNTTNKVYQADMSMFQKRFNLFEREYSKVLHYVQDYLVTCSEMMVELMKERK